MSIFRTLSYQDKQYLVVVGVGGVVERMAVVVVAVYVCVMLCMYVCVCICMSHVCMRVCMRVYIVHTKTYHGRSLIQWQLH